MDSETDLPSDNSVNQETPLINSEQYKPVGLMGGIKKFLPLIGFTLCFYSGIIGTTSLLPQYVLREFEIRANLTKTNETQLNPCTANISDPIYIKTQEIQEKSASLLAAATFAGGIPNIITVFIYGALSDRLGRKTIIAIPYIGLLMLAVALTFVTNIGAPFYIYVIASFVNGMCGSAATMMAGLFAYVADLTPPERRSLAIGLIEGCLGLSVVITNLLVGWLIQLLGFGHTMIFLTVLSTISIIFLIPMKETRGKRLFINSESTDSSERKCFYVLKSQLKDMKRLLTSDKQRSVLMLLMLVPFLIFMGLYVGTANVSSLYLMNRPFCWNSVYLGYYSAIRTAVTIVGGYLVLVYFRKKIADSSMVLISIVSFMGYFSVQGIASFFEPPGCNVLMIIGAVVGFCLSLTPILVRAVCSKLVSKDEQGAVFGLIASFEALAFGFAPTVFPVIYTATVEFFKPFVFFLGVGLLGIALLLLLTFRFLLRKRVSYIELSTRVS